MRRLVPPDRLPDYGIHFSKAHRNRLIRAGKFPKPVKSGTGGPTASNSFIEDEILAYIEALIAARDAEQAGREAA